MFELLKQRGGIAFYTAIFLNAFIDLGHKITVQNTVFKIHDGQQQIVLIAIVNALILLPYIALVLPIGRIANRTPKPQLMRATALFSVLCTALLLLCYVLGWFWGAFAMTLLMAIQSAVYSPAKLSYLKVLFGRSRLSQSNAMAQAVVIAGILLGTLLFSLAFEYLYQGLTASQLASGEVGKSAVTRLMAPLGVILVLLALVQAIVVWRVPILSEQADGAAHGSVPIGEGDNLRASSLADLLSRVTREPRLLYPVAGLALFWSVGQGMLAAFPAFAKEHAQITNVAIVQGVLAATAIGIALGAAVVARLSPGHINYRLIPPGVVGLAGGLWLLPLFDQAWQLATTYFLLGITSALLLVPMMASVQQQTGAGQIGGVIAGSNFFQNIAMLLMLLMTIAFAMAQASAQVLLQIIALLTTVFGAFIAWRVHQVFVASPAAGH